MITKSHASVEKSYLKEYGDADLKAYILKMSFVEGLLNFLIKLNVESGFDLRKVNNLDFLQHRKYKNLRIFLGDVLKYYRRTDPDITFIEILNFEKGRRNIIWENMTDREISQAEYFANHFKQ